MDTFNIWTPAVPNYRELVLPRNGISQGPPSRHPPPGTIVSHITRTHTPSESYISEHEAASIAEAVLNIAQCLGGGEMVIIDFIGRYLAYQPCRADVRAISCPSGIPRVLMPGPPAGEHEDRLIAPRPDMLWGYIYSAFDPVEKMKMANIKPVLTADFSPEGERIRLPFLTMVRCSPARGNLYTVGAECIVSIAVCLSLLVGIEDPVDHDEFPAPDAPMANIAYGFVIDSCVAELYVGWVKKDAGGGNVYMVRRIDIFMLIDPHDVTRFHDTVQNILEWGKGTRQHLIKRALELLPVYSAQLGLGGENEESANTVD